MNEIALIVIFVISLVSASAISFLQGYNKGSADGRSEMFHLISNVAQEVNDVDLEELEGEENGNKDQGE